MSDSAAIVAYNFYEHKDIEKLLAEGIEMKVSVKLVEVKDTTQTYDIGGSWVAVLYTPVGKKHAVTIRPVLTA